MTAIFQGSWSLTSQVVPKKKKKITVKLLSGVAKICYFRNNVNKNFRRMCLYYCNLQLKENQRISTSQRYDSVVSTAKHIPNPRAKVEILLFHFSSSFTIQKILLYGLASVFNKLKKIAIKISRSFQIPMVFLPNAHLQNGQLRTAHDWAILLRKVSSSIMINSI